MPLQLNGMLIKKITCLELLTNFTFVDVVADNKKAVTFQK